MSEQTGPRDCARNADCVLHVLGNLRQRRWPIVDIGRVLGDISVTRWTQAQVNAVQRRKSIKALDAFVASIDAKARNGIERLPRGRRSMENGHAVSARRLAYDPLDPSPSGCCMNEKVVFLAFKNDQMEPDMRDLIACKVCRNKTFIVIYKLESFPLLQCAACQTQIGHFGWTDDALRPQA